MPCHHPVVISKTLACHVITRSLFPKGPTRPKLTQLSVSKNADCQRFDPGGSLDRRVNCRCVSQPRWVDARRNTRGNKKGNRDFVLSYAQGGCACSRGLQAFTWERERACPSVRPPARPPSRTRALDLPFIDVRRGPRCTMGGVAMC
jgi:hypothetical protein